MRQTDIIEMPDGEWYAPRPESVNAGHARYLWVKRALGREIHIASPELWRKWASQYGVRLLVENADGSVSFKETP